MSDFGLIAKTYNLLVNNKDVMAIVFSSISLFFTARNFLFDRPRLRIDSKQYLYVNEYFKKYYSIEVVVLNIGRRDAALEGILYKYEDGNSSYVAIGEELDIIKENHRKIYKVDYSDLITHGSEGEIYYLEDIVILDNRHRELKIPNSKKFVAKMHQSGLPA